MIPLQSEPGILTKPTCTNKVNFLYLNLFPGLFYAKNKLNTNQTFKGR